MNYTLPTLKLIKNQSLLLGLAQTGQGGGTTITTFTTISNASDGELFDECGGGNQGFEGWLLQNIAVGAVITVTVDPGIALDPNDLNMVLMVFDPNNAAVQGSCVTGGIATAASLQFTAATAGEYEIHVNNQRQVGNGDDQDYTLSISGTNDGAPTLVQSIDNSNGGGGDCIAQSCPNTNPIN